MGTSESKEKEPEVKPEKKVCKGTSDDESLINPKFQARSEILDIFVEKMLGDKNLNITWLPDKLERQIYKFIVEQVVNKYFDCITGLDGSSLFGHHIELELIKGNNTLIGKPISAKNLNVIVERLMKNKSVEISWLPFHLQRDLFFHVVYLMLSILSLFVGTSECDIIGHRIGVTIDQVHTYLQKVNLEKSKIDNECLNRHIESVLAASKKKSYLPVHIEKSLHITVDVIVLNIMEDMFLDFRLNLIGDRVCFHLEAGQAPNAEGRTKEEELKKKAEEVLTPEMLAAKMKEYKRDLARVERRLSLVNKQIAVCDGETLSRKLAKVPVLVPVKSSIFSKKFF
jgi:hypothetical protein